jgi:Ca-activated chloride channel family protein
MFMNLRYRDPDGRQSRLLTHTVIDGTTMPSSDFTFAASVAAFEMVLWDSRYCGSTDLEAVLRWARSSMGEDLQGYRRAFVELVREAHELSTLDESADGWR